MKKSSENRITHNVQRVRNRSFPKVHLNMRIDQCVLIARMYKRAFFIVETFILPVLPVTTHYDEFTFCVYGIQHLINVQIMVILIVFSLSLSLNSIVITQRVFVLKRRRFPVIRVKVNRVVRVNDVFVTITTFSIRDIDLIIDVASRVYVVRFHFRVPRIP